MRIRTIALIILAVLAIVVGGVFYYSLTHPQKISDKDQAEIIKSTLELRFEQVKVENSKVIISLDNIWAVSQYTQGAYLSGGGFTIEYHRDFFGRWGGEVIHTWIS